MLDEQELIQQQMGKTRGSLTEKLEALEGQVSETVTSTAGAVQDTTHSVQETVTDAVETVKETVASVTDKVQETMTAVTEKFHETVQSVSDSFNLRLQMERHPWIVLGGAVAVGYFVGSSFGRGPQVASAATPPASSPELTPQPSSVTSSGRSITGGPSVAEDSGLVGGAISHLRDIGVSYLMGLVRDLARQGLPEMLGKRIGDEVDALTTKMGMEPVPETAPADPASNELEKDTESENPSDYQSKKSSAYRGRSPAGTATI